MLCDDVPRDAAQTHSPGFPVIAREGGRSSIPKCQ